jgi:hypothetical protein
MGSIRNQRTEEEKFEKIVVDWSGTCSSSHHEEASGKKRKL